MIRFNSQIYTTWEQSERLLALGLKKETADIRGVEGIEHTPTYAWSLHRLIELAYGNWKEDIVPIYLGNSYDMLIGRIEFQVKQGRFNKEYLV